MASKKIKVTPKGTDKTEQVLSLFQKSQAWIEEHSVQVLAGVVVVALIPVVFWGYSAYQDAQERRARQAYAHILTHWPQTPDADPKVYDEPIRELEKFSAEHQGAALAVNAELDLAQALYQVKRYDDSLKWAQKAVNGTSSGSELKALARYQLAQTCEALGKYDDALAQWSALKSEGSSGLTREVLWHLARIYSIKGDYAKAAEEYDAALKTSGMYPPTPMLQEEMALLKTKTGGAAQNPTVAPQKEKSQG